MPGKRLGINFTPLAGNGMPNNRQIKNHKEQGRVNTVGIVTCCAGSSPMPSHYRQHFHTLPNYSIHSHA